MSEQPKTVKEILQAIVADLQDLRANQKLIAVRVGTGVNPFDAQDAKTVTMKQVAAEYSDLIEAVEKLS
jgi:hypothetical protein